MKNLRKILCLMLALVCVLAFAGCGGGQNDEQAATDTVESFMDALMDLDIEEMKEYVTDEDDLDFGKFEEITAEALLDEITAGEPQMAAFADDFEPICEKMIDMIKDNLSYEITEVEKDGKNFVFAVEIEVPDFDGMSSNLNRSMNSIDINSIAQELLTSGKITATSSQQDIMNAIMPKIISVMDDALDNVKVTTDTEDCEVIVVKEGKEWLIDATESDVGNMMD